jgi:transloator
LSGNAAGSVPNSTEINAKSSTSDGPAADAFKRTPVTKNGTAIQSWIPLELDHPDDVRPGIVSTHFDSAEATLGYLMGQANSASSLAIEDQIHSSNKQQRDKCAAMEQRIKQRDEDLKKKENLSLGQKIANVFTKIFTFVASICTVAIAAVSTALTGGAAIPLLVMAVGLLAMDIAQTAGVSEASLAGLFKLMGVPENVAKYLGPALECAVSMGAAFAAARYLTKGLAVGATAASSYATTQASLAQAVRAASTVGKVSSGVGGASAASTSSIGIASAAVQQDVDKIKADLHQEQGELDLTREWQKQLINFHSRIAEQTQATYSTLASCNSLRNTTSTRMFA